MRSRLSAIGTGVFALLVAAVMLAAPAAASNLRSTVHLAPFSGYNASGAQLSTGPCGTTAKILKYPSFSPTTGKGSGSVNATAGSCAGPSTASNSEQAVAFIEMYGNQLPSMHGPIHFKAKWTLAYTGQVFVHSGGAGQSVFASAGVQVSGYLYNSTGFSTYYFNTYALSWYTSSGAALPFSGSGLVVTVYLNVTLASAAAYFLDVYVSMYVTDGSSLGGSSTAYGQVSMTGSAGSAKLDSLTY